MNDIWLPSKRIKHLGVSTEQVKSAGEIVAIIPAHNEEDAIARTIESLLDQTRKIDLIVVMADNCSDRTVEIASSYPEVRVMETVNNEFRKVGALLQAWDLYKDDFKYWLGVDADTALTRNSVEELYKEIEENPTIGGVMARYSFDQKQAKGLMARILVSMQRLEFAGWIDDLLANKRDTYVLGGQATLFRVEALRQVAEIKDRGGPWSIKTQVEDMDLTWELEARDWETKVNPEARAYVGSMQNIKTLWAQRRKWDAGLAELLHERGHDKVTAYPWKLQRKMLLDFTVRFGFIILLSSALVLDAFTWFWIWAAPPMLAALLNIRLAWYMPDRRKRDLLLGGTLIFPEAYLWFRLACWSVSWVNVLTGKTYDGWGKQYSAEGKPVLAGKVATNV